MPNTQHIVAAAWIVAGLAAAGLAILAAAVGALP